jgi:hypothetical protein
MSFGMETSIRSWDSIFWDSILWDSILRDSILLQQSDRRGDARCVVRALHYALKMRADGVSEFGQRRCGG